MMATLLFTLVALNPPAYWAGHSQSWFSHFEAGSRAVDQVHYVDAEKEFAAAIEIAEKFDEKDRRLAKSVLRLAEIEQILGRYGKAERLGRRALGLFERMGGAENADTARCWQLLAEAARMLGNYPDAEKLAKRALAIREKLLGKTKIEVMESLQTLAWIHHVRNGFGRMYERRLVNISESPEIGSSAVGALRVLAACHRLYGLSPDVDHDRRAEEEIANALAIAEKAHGASHPDVADCLTDQAAIFRDLGRLKEAERVQLRSLEILKETLGPRHPKVGIGQYGLALIYQSQGRHREAEPLFKEALRCRFSGLSDDELFQYFQSPADRWGYFHFGFNNDCVFTRRDSYLCEMLQRDGERVKFLLAQKERKIEEFWKRPDSAELDEIRNLEILTVLRRLQKRPDPLQVRVRGNRESTLPKLPEFEITLENVDEVPICLEVGGPWYGGISARCRFDVRDACGIPVPVHIERQVYDLGGASTTEWLKPGESTKISLRLSATHKLDPGDYTVRIQFHDWEWIAFANQTAGLILQESPPIRVHVEPRVVNKTKQDRDKK